MMITSFAIVEAQAAQALNTRSRKGKTHHLLISFRPEDEAKLTPEAFKAIEERLAAALGFSEHQRHCGIHKNTSNIHMRIAYNMIHPDRHTRHEPFRDYAIRDKLCRELEQEYGLTVDNGREQRRKPP
ncbi:MAG: relaxase/mobilization nuclease domain-containing protein [Desulfovibrio sp.]|nr:relaxase/mobilization nuclease domain-containing protein [Desulfovibrio sp.]